MKPLKRKLEKESEYLQYDKGYNHAWEEWTKHNKETLSICRRVARFAEERIVDNSNNPEVFAFMNTIIKMLNPIIKNQRG